MSETLVREAFGRVQGETEGEQRPKQDLKEMVETVNGAEARKQERATLLAQEIARINAETDAAVAALRAQAESRIAALTLDLSDENPCAVRKQEKEVEADLHRELPGRILAWAADPKNQRQGEGQWQTISRLQVRLGQKQNDDNDPLVGALLEIKGKLVVSGAMSQASILAARSEAKPAPSAP